LLISFNWPIWFVVCMIVYNVIGCINIFFKHEIYMHFIQYSCVKIVRTRFSFPRRILSQHTFPFLKKYVILYDIVILQQLTIIQVSFYMLHANSWICGCMHAWARFLTLSTGCPMLWCCFSIIEYLPKNMWLYIYSNKIYLSNW
jgi:hypothetical protein